MTLIAEDLLLLLLDDDEGHRRRRGAPPTPCWAARCSLELARRTGRSRCERGRHLAHRPRCTPPAPPPASTRCWPRRSPPSPRRPRTAQDLVNRLGKGLATGSATAWPPAGILRARGRQAARPVSADVADGRPVHEDEVRRHLSDALVRGARPRTSAPPRSSPCCIAIGRAHKVVALEGVPAGTVKARAKEIADGRVGGRRRSRTPSPRRPRRSRRRWWPRRPPPPADA